MATCPKCRSVYDDEVPVCPGDGAVLLPDDLCIPAEPPIEEGTMIGEYRVLRKLGTGSFGEVFAGEHPLIGKKVAIKILHRKFADQPEMVSRFVAEARAVNKIRHRNIIDIFAFGVQKERERHYFVMELCEGVTLGELCARRGRLPPETALRIVRGIAAALDAAHDAGITHRDLKPENVFLVAERDGSWFPKLLDFGVAKLMDEDSLHDTTTGVVLGTPRYMSPEQARGEAIGPAADVYALGVMLHEMLTGEPPFGGASAMAVMHAHTHEPPPRLSGVCADLPPALDDAVLAMLAKSPAERPPSASEAVAALEAAARRLGASDVSSTQTAASVTIDPPPKPWRFGLVAVAGAGLAGAALIWAATGRSSASSHYDGTSAEPRPASAPPLDVPAVSTPPPEAAPKPVIEPSPAPTASASTRSSAAPQAGTPPRPRAPQRAAAPAGDRLDRVLGDRE